MIPSEVRADIEARLSAAEKTEDVRVLLAIESGSRAWGFSSPNSDYDIRFIYVRRPDWYLAVDLEDKRDIIEYPIVDDIDLNGWDIRKALRLFWKSNPTFAEWIQSPIIYRSSGVFFERVRALLPSMYYTVSGMYHYRSMAKGNYRDYLQADLVPLKKYFYVLRPLLATRWIELHNAAPPIEFEKLLAVLEGQEELLTEIDKLLALKRGAAEMSLAPPIRAINEFIEAELSRLDGVALESQGRPGGIEELNKLFKEVLEEEW